VGAVACECLGEYQLPRSFLGFGFGEGVVESLRIEGVVVFVCLICL